MYRKFKKVALGLLAHETPEIFFSRILRSEALAVHIFFRTAVLRKLFDIRFSYKHCNFSRVCLLVKMAGRKPWQGLLQNRGLQSLFLFFLSSSSETRETEGTRFSRLARACVHSPHQIWRKRTVSALNTITAQGSPAVQHHRIPTESEYV